MRSKLREAAIAALAAYPRRAGGRPRRACVPITPGSPSGGSWILLSKQEARGGVERLALQHQTQIMVAAEKELQAAILRGRPGGEFEFLQKLRLQRIGVRDDQQQTGVRLWPGGMDLGDTRTQAFRGAPAA